MNESPSAGRSGSPVTLGRTLAAMGQDRPVVFDELMAAPLVVRHKDVSAALRSSSVFSTAFSGTPPMEKGPSSPGLGSPMNEELAEPGRRAFSELRAYTETLVVPADPGDNNLLDDVVRAHLAEGGFSTDECVMAVISLLLGGFETTIQMLSGTLASLLLNRRALSAVRADHLRIDGAIDEAFRRANPSAGLY